MPNQNLKSTSKDLQNSQGILNQEPKTQTDQDSHEELNSKIDQTQNHLPQGDLIIDLSEKLSCKTEAFLDLPIKKILHFEIIHDFKIPTRSAYPIVIIFKDSGHCHCVDGWNLVHEAKEKGDDTIKCHVFYMDSFDEAATGIFKLAMRSMPIGGNCTHAEMIFNIRMCFRLIKRGNETPKALGHGGNRKGPEFDNNFDQRVIELLVEQLGKTKKKIREYINHGSELPDETLKFLVEKKAGRRFFEATQRNKFNVVAKLKQDGITEDAILEEIGARMKGWYEEYETTGEIIDELKKTELSSEETSKIPDKIIVPTKKESRVHKHWEGNTAIEEEIVPTKAQLYEELETILEPMNQLNEEQPDICEDMIQQCLNVATQLIFLTETMEQQLNFESAVVESEVA